MRLRERVVFGVYGAAMLLGGEKLAFGGAWPDPWPAVGWWLMPTEVVLLLVAIGPPVARIRRPSGTRTARVQRSAPEPQTPTPSPLPRPGNVTDRSRDLHSSPR